MVILNLFSEDINKQVDRNKQQRYQFYPGKYSYSYCQVTLHDGGRCSLKL